jgi:hypothetical protein
VNSKPHILSAVTVFIATVLAFAMATVDRLEAGTVYSQDFTSNPGFTSLSPANAYWDSGQGNYYVRTKDDLAGQYWAYSPTFGPVPAAGDITISLDVLFEEQNWGTYPGVRFFDTQPTSITVPCSLMIDNSYSDYSIKAMAFTDCGSNRYETPHYSIEDNVWYRVTMVLHAATNKADLSVATRSTGSVVGSFTNVNFAVRAFRWLGVGYYNEPDYGSDWSPIRLDNVLVSTSTGAADLAVTGLSVTRSGDSRLRTFSGCSFNVVNNGPTALSSEFILVDYYLSDDTSFGDADDRKIGDTGFTVSIASGATLPITLSPSGLGYMSDEWVQGLVPNGSYYVFAKVRLTDGSPTDPTPSNDYARTSSTVSYSGEVLFADLALTSLSVTRPPADSASRTFTGCSFNVVNNGPTALSSEFILIDYYLSDDTSFGDADDRKVGDTGFTVSIASGATLPITLSPSGLGYMSDEWVQGLVPNGSYYVFAKVRLTDGSPTDPTPSNDCARTGSSFAYSESQPVRVVKVAAGATGSPGGAVGVPIELVAQGDENALGFSLNFDPAVLSNPVAALGSGAAGASLNTNTTQAASGKLGVALALPAGQIFAAGTRQLVVVTFNAAPGTTATSTEVGFGDQPIAREVASATATALAATWTAGTVTIILGYEADVAPRPNGNGTVSTTDWVQVGRFAAGLDTAAPGSEFQRADCAPRSSLGNGAISTTDWVQAGRYAAGLDPLTPAGGPTAAASSVAPGIAVHTFTAGGPGSPGSPRRVALRTLDLGDEVEITVTLDATGDENALGISLAFDPQAAGLVGALPGRDAGGALLNLNVTDALTGRIGFAVALPAGRALDGAGAEVVVLRFTRASFDAAKLLRVDIVEDGPVAAELVSIGAELLPLAIDNGMEADRPVRRRVGSRLPEQGVQP